MSYIPYLEAAAAGSVTDVSETLSYGLLLVVLLGGLLAVSIAFALDEFTIGSAVSVVLMLAVLAFVGTRALAPSPDTGSIERRANSQAVAEAFSDAGIDTGSAELPVEVGKVVTIDEALPQDGYKEVIGAGSLTYLVTEDGAIHLWQDGKAIGADAQERRGEGT